MSSLTSHATSHHDELALSDTVSNASMPLSLKGHKARKRMQKPADDGHVESRNVTAACQFCRRLRRKCEGGNPCKNCVRSKSQCIFDKQPDRRHREYKEKVSHELNERARMYDALIHAIKVTDEADLLHLIHDLKQGDDTAVKQLVHRVKESDSDDTQSDRLQYRRPLQTSSQSSNARSKRKRPSISSESSWQSYEPQESRTAVSTAPSSFQSLSPSLQRRRSTSRDRVQQMWPWFESNGSVEGFGNLPISSAVRANNYPEDVQKNQLMYFQQPEYLTPSLLIHNQDGLPIWNVCTSFSTAARDLLSRGVSAHQVVGSGPVDVSLLFRQKTELDLLSANTFACDMARVLLLKQTKLQNYPDLASFLKTGTISPQDEPALLVAIALVSGLTRLTRWNLLPTSELYSQIPEMSRPLPAQRLIPHFPDVDLCVHPVSRRCLMRQYRDFTGVTDLPGCGASLRWPHSFKETVAYNAETGQLLITKDFEDFVAKPDNWSWSSRILEIFPEAKEMGAIMLSDENESTPSSLGHETTVLRTPKLPP